MAVQLRELVMSTAVFRVCHQGLVIGIYADKAKAEAVASYRGGMFGEPAATVTRHNLSDLNGKAEGRAFRRARWLARQADKRKEAA